MKKSDIISLVLGLFITMPIWFYLIYWILSQLNPDRLIWFLYGIYVPSSIIIQVISKVGGEK